MPKKLRRVLSWIDLINRRAAEAACYLGLLLMISMTYEVVMRYVFTKPTSWSMELSQFLFCIMIVLGGAWGLEVGAHVNVDILYSRFGVRTRAIISIITYLLLFGFLIFMIWITLKSAMQSLAWAETSGSGWDPPIYPIKFFVPLGALLLLLQAIARFIRYIIQATTGVEEAKETGLQIESGAE